MINDENKNDRILKWFYNFFFHIHFLQFITSFLLLRLRYLEICVTYDSIKVKSICLVLQSAFLLLRTTVHALLSFTKEHAIF